MWYEFLGMVQSNRLNIQLEIRLICLLGKLIKIFNMKISFIKLTMLYHKFLFKKGNNTTKLTYNIIFATKIEINN